MTETTINALIVAVPVLITAMGGVIVNILTVINRKVDENTITTNATARKMDANTVTTEATAVKADEIIGKTDANSDKADTIITQTDGHLTKLQDQLAEQVAISKVQNETITRLEARVIELAGKLAREEDEVTAQEQRDKFKIG